MVAGADICRQRRLRTAKEIVVGYTVIGREPELLADAFDVAVLDFVLLLAQRYRIGEDVAADVAFEQRVAALAAACFLPALVGSEDASKLAEGERQTSTSHRTRDDTNVFAVFASLDFDAIEAWPAKFRKNDFSPDNIFASREHFEELAFGWVEEVGRVVVFDGGLDLEEDRLGQFLHRIWLGGAIAHEIEL